MNRTIRHVSVFCLLLVLALLGRATWVQAYQAQALADDDHNRRNIIAQYAQPLGDIIVAGNPVTGSKGTVGSDLAYKRTYTQGSSTRPSPATARRHTAPRSSKGSTAMYWTAPTTG